MCLRLLAVQILVECDRKISFEFRADGPELAGEDAAARRHAAEATCPHGSTSSLAGKMHLQKCLYLK